MYVFIFFVKRITNLSKDFFVFYRRRLIPVRMWQWNSNKILNEVPFKYRIYIVFLIFTSSNSSFKKVHCREKFFWDKNLKGSKNFCWFRVFHLITKKVQIYVFLNLKITTKFTFWCVDVNWFLIHLQCFDPLLDQNFLPCDLVWK